MVKKQLSRFYLSFLLPVIAKKADDNKEIFDGFNLSS